jgi:hypothetical protein
MNVKVPEGMLKAALPYCDNQMHSALEAALQWLAENPIVPTDEQAEELRSEWNNEWGGATGSFPKWAVTEWQRRMFRAEPEVPEAVKHLLSDTMDGQRYFNARILEAYRIGLEQNKNGTGD